mmetsp:Transcript_133030/g.384776  ORF Transcript_133030/g.384776 Transcript_133030/m.384776 type:complete len:283 (-) Transcript_133030:143-991(-)
MPTAGRRSRRWSRSATRPAARPCAAGRARSPPRRRELARARPWGSKLRRACPVLASRPRACRRAGRRSGTSSRAPTTTGARRRGAPRGTCRLVPMTRHLRRRRRQRKRRRSRGKPRQGQSNAATRARPRSRWYAPDTGSRFLTCSTRCRCTAATACRCTRRTTCVDGLGCGAWRLRRRMATSLGRCSHRCNARRRRETPASGEPSWSDSRRPRRSTGSSPWMSGTLWRWRIRWRSPTFGRMPSGSRRRANARGGFQKSCWAMASCGAGVQAPRALRRWPRAR